MPFESGAISFSLFHVRGRLPSDAVARFAARAAPPLSELGSEEIRGWVGGRHLLDVPITEESAYQAGHLRLTFLRAERRAPAALVRAHCLMEELAAQRAAGRPWLKRQERSEIRRMVVERLLPEMPPRVRALPILIPPRSPWLLSPAMSEPQRDLLSVEFLKTVGVKLEPATPESLAEERGHADPSTWGPTSFSPEVPEDEADASPGRQFLTWLWFCSEEREGRGADPEGGEFAFALDGPLVFQREGEGAHETLVRRGAPLLSAEAKTCLLAGKTLRAARLIFARGDREWRAAFDADRFAVRGLRVPEDRSARKSWDPATRFQERMQAVEEFIALLLALYDGFVKERSDPRRWRATQREMQTWATQRRARR